MSDYEELFRQLYETRTHLKNLKKLRREYAQENECENAGESRREDCICYLKDSFWSFQPEPVDMCLVCKVRHKLHQEIVAAGHEAAKVLSKCMRIGRRLNEHRPDN